jgi:aminoglycoside/choline kinase family phosphotransferase
LAWGLSVPEIYNFDLAKGLVLMSDLGDDLYLHKLNVNTAEELYSAALEALLTLQRQESPSSWLLPRMEEDYISQQLKVFQQWFLQQHLQLDMALYIQEIILELKKIFIPIFTKQPQVLVHLDYHSRNLLVLPGNKVGILDFQDAMLGPVTYDLVSLFQDAYISWPREIIETWLMRYRELAMAAKIISPIKMQDFMRWFDLVGLQRHLKNLGVFARLHHRDNKPKYLKDIPMLIRYILEICNRYAELANIKLFFVEMIVPSLKGITCKQ